MTFCVDTAVRQYFVYN